MVANFQTKSTDVSYRAAACANYITENIEYYFMPVEKLAVVVNSYPHNFALLKGSFCKVG